MKITTLIFLVVLGVLYGCDRQPHPKIDFDYGAFGGNGSHFSYKRTIDGISTLYLTDIDGNVVKTIRDDKDHSIQGAFLNGAFYYVEFSASNRSSKIMKCDETASNCRRIYQARGSIKCLFDYRNRLHFYRSPYEAVKNGPEGYFQYQIESITFEGIDERTHFHQKFTFSRCPVVVDGRAYASLKLPNEPTFEIKGDKFITRDDYTLISNEEKYSLRREELDINRSIYLILFIKEELAYAAITYNGRYRYGFCNSVNNCEIEKPTTNLVYSDNKIYYAIWDAESENLKIYSVGL